MDLPELVPLVEAGVALRLRLPPDLEREPRAVAALAARVRVLRRIARRVVDVVVVPATPGPLIALVTSSEGDGDRAVTRDVRRGVTGARGAVQRDEARVVRAR